MLQKVQGPGHTENNCGGHATRRIVVVDVVVVVVVVVGVGVVVVRLF